MHISQNKHHVLCVIVYFLHEQVLQTYQAYQETQSETQTPTRQMNTHITYHVAQANQAEHGSLVDRGANGGLAGSDVRVLSTSSRKCTVADIDNHEIPGFDLVECAALVQTNLGMVNLIMNNRLLKQKEAQTNNNLAGQQVSNNKRAK